MHRDDATTGTHMEVFGATVRQGPVPLRIEDPLVRTPWLDANRNEAVIALPDIGRAHVADGRVVTMALRPGVALADCDVWLRGLIASVVLLQQARFALHASSVRIGNLVVAVAGASGAGKSTTAATLFGRGHELVTDEITAVDVDIDAEIAQAIVVPSPRTLRLDPATASRLGLDVPPPLASDPGGKSVVALPGAGPAVLGLLVVLRTSPELAAARVVGRLGRLPAVRSLRAHTYRPSLASLAPAAHHEWVVGVAGRVPVVELVRPGAGWSVDAVADLVESLAAEVPAAHADAERSSFRTQLSGCHERSPA